MKVKKPTAQINVVWDLPTFTTLVRASWDTPWGKVDFFERYDRQDFNPSKTFLARFEKRAEHAMHRYLIQTINRRRRSFGLPQFHSALRHSAARPKTKKQRRTSWQPKPRNRKS